MRLGHDDQPNGIRRTWDGLRRRLYRPGSGIEREEIERPQQLRVRGNQPADEVSYTLKFQRTTCW